MITVKDQDGVEGLGGGNTEDCLRRDREDDMSGRIANRQIRLWRSFHSKACFGRFILVKLIYMYKQTFLDFG